MSLVELPKVLEMKAFSDVPEQWMPRLRGHHSLSSHFRRLGAAVGLVLLPHLHDPDS